MNRRHAGWATVTLLGLFLYPAAGKAADPGTDTLQFEVTGTITPSCSLVANRIRIDLGNVSVSELPAVGEAARWGAAAFMATDCVGATHASVTVHGVASAEDARYLATGGDAGGVAIELRTGSGQAVLPDGLTPVRFDLVAQAPELRFEARYVRVGPLRPGNAPATALVQITWE